MAEADFDIPALMQEASAQAARITGINAQIQSLIPTSDSVDQLVALVAGGSDRNGDTPVSLRTRELGALEAQQKKQEFYKQIGNGQGYAKVATDLSTQFYDAMEAAKGTAQSVAQRKSVGLLDNPIAWAVNRVILPDEEAQLSGELAQAKIASDQLQTLTKMSDDEARIENEFATKLTTAAIDSKVQALSNNLAANALQTRMSAQSQSVHTLAAVMNAQGEQLKHIKYVIDARNSAAHLAMAEKEFAIRTEQFAAWKKENAEKQEFAAQMTDWYNVGADIRGRPHLTTDKVMLMLKSGGMQAQEAQALTELGFQNLNQGNVKLGVTPATAIEMVQKTRGQVPEQFSKLYEYGFAVSKQLAADGKIDTKNPAAVSQAFNQAVLAKASEYQSSVDYRDQTNPYILPPPKLLAENPAIQSTRLYQKVLAPLIANESLTTSDPQKIVALGLEAVKSGTITMKDLGEGITEYYSTGVVINNIGRDFHKYAIPEQTTYNSTLDIPSVFGTSAFQPKAKVNLVDPVSVNQYLVKVRNSIGGMVQGY